MAACSVPFLQSFRTQVHVSSQLSSSFTDFRLESSPSRLISRTALGSRIRSQYGNHFGRDFADAFKDNSSRVLRSVKEKFNDFDKENDVKGKLKSLLESANNKYEKFEFSVKRNGARLIEEYRIDEKFEKVTSVLNEAAQDVDQKFRVKQRVSVAVQDFQRDWPRYQRSIKALLDSPAGGFITWFFFAWLLLSGWFFRIIFFSAWILPLLPFVLQFIARQSLIEGQCPNCGFPYAGAKSSVLVCRKCRGVVWQPGQARGGPGQKFDKNDPNVIDIDVD